MKKSGAVESGGGVAMASRIELWPVARLKPYAKNARTHSAEQIGQIAASILQFGFTAPILVDGSDGILAGHGRLLGALKLGMAEVPVIQLEHLTPAQARAYILADNQLALNAGWDDDLLAEELKALAAENFDLDVIGFSAKELEELVGYSGPAAPEPQIDRAAELQRKWKTARGQVWEIGKHRLMCGDSTSAEDVRWLMAGALAQMVFTDPPYGVDYDGGAKKREKLVGDNAGTDVYGRSLVHLRSATDDQAALYLWYADAHAAAAAAAAAGFTISAQIIWAKNHAQFVSSAHYHGKHEPCFYAHRTGKSARWFGGKTEVTLWEYPRASANEFHPTQKPVEIPARAMRNSSQDGQIVLDLFLGSGSTMVAAEQLGRVCYGMEIEPKYVAVCLERMSGMGLIPKLAS